MPDINDSVDGNFSVPTIGPTLTLNDGYSNTVTITEATGNTVALVDDGSPGNVDMVTDESALGGTANTIELSDGSYSDINTVNAIGDQISIGGGSTAVLSGSGGNSVSIAGAGNTFTDESSTANTLALSGSDTVVLAGGAGADTVADTTGATLGLVDDGSGATSVTASDDTINISGTGGNAITVIGGGDNIFDDPTVHTNTIAISGGTVTEAVEGDTVDVSGTATVNATWTNVNVGGSGGNSVSINGNSDDIIDDSSSANTLALNGSDFVTLNGGAGADTVTDTTGATLRLTDDGSGDTNVTASGDTINIGGDGGNVISVTGTDNITDDPWVLTNTIAVNGGTVTEAVEGDTVDVSGTASVIATWTTVNVSGSGGNSVSIIGNSNAITDDSSSGNTLAVSGSAFVTLSGGAGADTVTDTTGVTLRLTDDGSGNTGVTASGDAIDVGGNGGNIITVTGSGNDIIDDPWGLTNTIAVSSGTVTEAIQGDTVDVSGTATVNATWTNVNVAGSGGNSVRINGNSDDIIDDSSSGNTLALNGSDFVTLNGGGGADSITDSTGATLRLTDDGSGDTNVTASGDTINVGGDGGNVITVTGTDTIVDDPWGHTNTIAVSSGTVTEAVEGDTVDVSGTASVIATWTNINVSGSGGNSVSINGNSDDIIDDSSSGNTLALNGNDFVTLSGGAGADTVTDTTGATLRLTDDGSGNTTVTASGDTINVDGDGGNVITVTGTDNIVDDPWLLTNTIALSSGTLTEAIGGDTVDINGTVSVYGSHTDVNLKGNYTATLHGAGGNIVTIYNGSPYEGGSKATLDDLSAAANTVVVNDNSYAYIDSSGDQIRVEGHSTATLYGAGGNSIGLGDGVDEKLYDDSTGSNMIRVGGDGVVFLTASDDHIGAGGGSTTILYGGGGNTVSFEDGSTEDTIRDYSMDNIIDVGSGGAVSVGASRDQINIGGSSKIDLYGSGGNSVTVTDGTTDMIYDSSSAFNSIYVNYGSQTHIDITYANADHISLGGSSELYMTGVGGGTITVSGGAADSIYEDSLAANSINVYSGSGLSISGYTSSADTVVVHGTGSTIADKGAHIELYAGSAINVINGNGNTAVVESATYITGTGTDFHIYAYVGDEKAAEMASFNGAANEIALEATAYVHANGLAINLGNYSKAFLYGTGNTVTINDGTTDTVWNDTSEINTIYVGSASKATLSGAGGQTVVVNDAFGDFIYDHSYTSNMVDISGGFNTHMNTYGNDDQISIDGSYLVVYGNGGNTITAVGTGNILEIYSTAADVIDVGTGSALDITGRTSALGTVVVSGTGSFITTTYGNAVEFTAESSATLYNSYGDTITATGNHIGLANDSGISLNGGGGNTVTIDEGTHTNSYSSFVDNSTANAIDISGVSQGSAASITANGDNIYLGANDGFPDSDFIFEKISLHGSGNTVYAGTDAFDNQLYKSQVDLFTTGNTVDIIGGDIYVYEYAPAGNIINVEGGALHLWGPESADDTVVVSAESATFSYGAYIELASGSYRAIIHGSDNTIAFEVASDIDIYNGQIYAYRYGYNRDLSHQIAFINGGGDADNGDVITVNADSSIKDSSAGADTVNVSDGSIANIDVDTVNADTINVRGASTADLSGTGGNTIYTDEAGESITDSSGASNTIDINGTSAGNTTIAASNDAINFEVPGTPGGSITLSGGDDDSVYDRSGGGNTVDLIGNTNAKIHTYSAVDDVISVYSVSGDSGNSSVTIYGDGGNTIVTNEANESVTDLSTGINTIEITDIDSNGNNSQITANNDTIYFEDPGVSRGSGVMLAGGTDDTVNDVHGGNLIILNGNSGASINASDDLIGAIGTTTISEDAGGFSIYGDSSGTVTGTNDTIAVQGSSTITAADYSIALYGATVDLEGGGGNTVSFSGMTGGYGTNVFTDDSTAVNTFDVGGGNTTINTVPDTADDIIDLSGGSLTVSGDDAINVASGTTAGLYGSGGNTVTIDGGSVDLTATGDGNSIYATSTNDTVNVASGADLVSVNAYSNSSVDLAASNPATNEYVNATGDEIDINISGATIYVYDSAFVADGGTSTSDKFAGTGTDDSIVFVATQMISASAAFGGSSAATGGPFTYTDGVTEPTLISTHP